MIYYLVQGEAYQYPDRMAEMANSGAEVIFLTWDKPVDGALFLPNSTCMQGRNFLLDHVLKNNYKFEYLVFIDGDAKPIKGSWAEFNRFLLEKKPQASIPLMQLTQRLLHRQLKPLHLASLIPEYQRALLIDDQVTAYRKDVIAAVKTFIYPAIFDSVSWHFNTSLSKYILKYIIPYNIIQFNKLELENNSHIQYQKSNNIKYITNYISKLGLSSLLPFFQLKNNTNIHVSRLIVLLDSFIEIFYLIPFPIKEFDVAKRAEYVKKCLQKMKTIDIPKNNKTEDCTNI